MNTRATILTALLLSAVSFSFGQNNGWCKTDQHNQELLKNNPQQKQQYENNLERINEMIAKGSAKAKAVRVVPCVIHIIHDNGAGDITLEQVQDGLKVMTEDFRRINSDTGSTRAIFKPYAADSELEFRLAQKDPNGNCHSGINRINSPLTNDADDAVKSLSNWPSDQYFNIWIVRTIAGGSQQSIILGYAQFPGAGSWNTFGVVMRNDAFGRIGTANSDGRTASHEAGHCFGLFHTFQSGCGNNCSSSGDQVCDTPPASAATYGCNTSQNSCSNDANGPDPFGTNVVDQIENYMSYDACTNMFSQGQADRMNAVIDFYSNLTNLVSPANLVATGVDGNDILCAADFITNTNEICAGDAVEFTDQSYHAPTQWDWSFPGAHPSYATTQDATTYYYGEGVFDVTLEVSNGNDTKTTTVANKITVLPSPGELFPFSESFENSPIPNNKWLVNNPNNDGEKWLQTPATWYTGNKCVWINNYNSDAGERDDFTTYPFDASQYSSVTLSFKMAYCQRTAGNNDRLRVYASVDCGKTWYVRYTGVGAGMATSNPQSNLFTPTSTNQWEEVTITNITAPTFTQENLRFKFEIENDGGNAMYIDDINITGVFNPVPVLVSPNNNATAVADDELLDWKFVENVDYYEYELDTSNTFSSSAYQTGTVSYISATSTGTDTEFQTNNLMHAQKYYWRVRSITNSTPSNWSATWNFTVSQSGVGINEESSATSINLFPNPAKENVTLQLYTEQSATVKITLTNIMGSTVKTFPTESATKGLNNFYLQTNGLSDGVYFLTVETDGKVFVEKLVIK